MGRARRDPSGKQRQQSFERQVDTKNFAANMHTAVATGDYVDPAGGKVRFRDRYETWASTVVDLRPSTRARDESYAHSLVLPTFADRRVGDIGTDEVAAWVAELTAEGYAPATVHKAHQILAKVMQSAVDARLIGSMGSTAMKLPRIERVEQRFLSPPARWPGWPKRPSTPATAPSC